MVIQNDPSARMQLRSRGELNHPGSCMVCGSGNNDEGYLDLSVFFDYEGTMYLCMTCAYQAGETVGLYTPNEVASQLSLIEQLRVENDTLRKELENARPFFGAFKQFMSTVGMSDDVIDSVASEIASKVKHSEQPDITVTTEGTDSGESESKESVTEPGPSDLERSELRDSDRKVFFS